MRLVSRERGRKGLLAHPQLLPGIWSPFQVSVAPPPSNQMGPRVRPMCSTNVETEAQTWLMLVQISDVIL